MYVCVCNKVTDGQIRQAAERGVCSMDELHDELKVASCCGRCHDCAKRVLQTAVTEQWQQASFATAACACA
ncbi:(2Fe-2S)-binding protein [Thiosocius teredinicola]|uniref:(2Fe-2S)-binding protein n=1 Tax=Thiosocius teredinicola TaxID=1973002 RepID=UPI0009913A20